MLKLLKACGAHWYGWVALACLVVVGVAWLVAGLAPGWLTLALPIIGVIVCLAPCALPLLWLRREWRRADAERAKPVTEQPPAA